MSRAGTKGPGICQPGPPWAGLVAWEDLETNVTELAWPPAGHLGLGVQSNHCLPHPTLG